MEIVDDRHDRASTIVTSQVPVTCWTMWQNMRSGWC